MCGRILGDDSHAALDSARHCSRRARRPGGRRLPDWRVRLGFRRHLRDGPGTARLRHRFPSAGADRPGHIRLDVGARRDRAGGPRSAGAVDVLRAVPWRARAGSAATRPRAGGRRRRRRDMARGERVPRRRSGRADGAGQPGPDAHDDEHRDVRAGRRRCQAARRAGGPALLQPLVRRRRASAPRARRTRRVGGAHRRRLRTDRHHGRQRDRGGGADGGRPGAHRHEMGRPVPVRT